MNEAVQFLTALAQSMSTLTLYAEGHPSRERAIDAVWDTLGRLQEVSPAPTFTLLDGEVVLDGQPVRALRSWEWSTRFSRMGIQRIEILGPVERPDLELFLEEILGIVSGEPTSSAEARTSRPTRIRYGAVGVQSDDPELDLGSSSITTATLGYNLKEEVETVEWLHQEMKGGRRLNLLEAESIVRSLTVAMHGDQEFLIPLLRLKEFDQYTTTHALNVSVLAMALAEYIGLGPGEVRSFGISGLLHDLGKVTIPDEILNKPGKLTESEREVMNSHTVEGARMILETEEHLDLAAVVAYEHHIKIDGGGYPSLRHPRRCHQASDLVHVCDVFDALRTKRPYRDAWEEDRVLEYMTAGAGSEFDEELTQAFVRMIRTWSSRVAYLERPDQDLRPRAADEARGGPGDREVGDGTAAGVRDSAGTPDEGDGRGAETPPGDEGGITVIDLEPEPGDDVDALLRSFEDDGEGLDMEWDEED